MKVFRMINILILISFLFVSCGEKFESNAEVSEKAYITLDFSSARTVLPEFELSKLSDIVLKGSRNGASQEILASFDTVSSINNVGIDVGNWDFILTAKQDNTSFSGTQSKKIEPGENSLSFTLSVVDFGDAADVGSVKVSLEFPADAGVVCVKAGLFDISGKNQIGGFESDSVEISGAIVVYEKTEVPVGQYLLKFDFYGDADCKAYINAYKEIIKIASGCSSAAERSVDNLNEVYQISLELNGGELVGGTSIPAAYTRNSEKIVLPDVLTLRKDGYVLDGIYETPDFAGERINEVSPEDEKSYSLYAKWNRGVVITADEISSLDLTTQTEEYDIAVYGDATNSDVSRLGEKVKASTADVNLKLKSTTGLTAIGDSAFKDCSSLASIEIPEGVAIIGSYAFRGCSSLTSIEIPLSVTRMEFCAFFQSLNIENIYYAGTASQWLNIATESTGGAAIPRASNFYSKGKLLEDVVVDSTVKQIPVGAFDDNKSIKTLEISEGVTSIDCSFRGCSSLTSIKIPLSVSSMDGSAFYQSDNIENIYYAGTASQWLNIDDVPLLCASNFYSKGKLLENVVVESTVKQIPDSAFDGNKNIKTIEILEGVTSIGNYAFYNCSSLTTVKIPPSVIKIGTGAFGGSSRLSSVFFEDTENWYQTTSKTYDDGYKISVSNPESNAYMFKTYDHLYYYYKR